MEFSLKSVGQAAGDDTDLRHLEQRLCESLHQLHLKRITLDEARKELNAAYLARHEQERSLDRARREYEEVQLQLELANGALRRWEEERGGVRETASRQRVQLDAALAERDMLKDQARDLQMENMKLRRKAEEVDGQLRYQATYQESNTTGQNKLRSIHEQIVSEVHRLEDDQKRLEQTMVVTKSQASNALMCAEHNACLRNQSDKERTELEEKVVQLEAKIEVMRMSNNKSTDKPRSTNDGNVAALQEQIRELECRLASEIECTAVLSGQQQVAVKQQEIFKKLEQEASEKFALEEKRAIRLEEGNSTLVTENQQLKENLRTLEKALILQRELAKKAECVERGVQCNITEAEVSVLQQTATTDIEIVNDPTTAK